MVQRLLEISLGDMYNIIVQLNKVNIYFMEHVWLGAFFILQIIIIFFLKASIDYMNTVYFVD